MKAANVSPLDRPFSEHALEVLRERYLRRNEAGELVETPDGMLARVARAVAEPAKIFGEDKHSWEARFLDRMRRLEFLPNSPTLMNEGHLSFVQKTTIPVWQQCKKIWS